MPRNCVRTPVRGTSSHGTFSYFDPKTQMETVHFGPTAAK